MNKQKRSKLKNFAPRNFSCVQLIVLSDKKYKYCIVRNEHTQL